MKVDFCGRKCLEVDKGVWGGASYLLVLPLGARIKSICWLFKIHQGTHWWSFSIFWMFVAVQEHVKNNHHI